MLRFIIRHFTAILVVAVLGWWGIFYMPQSPTWAVLGLRTAVHERDGEAAARYIDFQSVVQHAAKEMVNQDAANNPLGALVGQAAAQMLAQPLARVAESWAIQRVNEGDPNLQIPFAAVAGAVVMLHRSGDSAWTRFTDRKGQTWEIHMTREASGWQITQVNNIRELLQKFEQHEAKGLKVGP